MLIQLDECPSCKGAHDRVNVSANTDGVLTGTCPTSGCLFTVPGLTTGDAPSAAPEFFTAAPPVEPAADDDQNFRYVPEGRTPRDG